MAARKYRTYPCADCGKPTVKQTRRPKPHYCGDCASRRIEAAARGMANKQGEAWSNWLASKGPAGRPPKNRKGT